MSHAPHIVAFADRAPAVQRNSFYRAAMVLRSEILKSRPDVLAVISSDHFTNFGFDVIPALAIGTADVYTGPIEDWLGLPTRQISGAGDVARCLSDCLIEDGFDLALCNEFVLEHGMMVPLHFVDPDGDFPLLPIVQNCTVPPLPTLGRCFAFGQALHAAARAYGVRMAVVGAGGLSHAPGATTSEHIDEGFDLAFLARLNSRVGSDDPCTLFPAERIDAAGFGTWEIRQWFAAWGAAGGAAARTLSYEPIAEWEIGCAVAVFDVQAGRHPSGFSR